MSQPDSGMMKASTIATRRVADLVMAATFIILTQIEVWVFTLGSPIGIGTRVGASILTAIAAAALAWRRSRPTASFWVNSAAVVGTIALGYPSDIYQWTNLIATYSVGAYGVGTQRWVALIASVGGVVSYFVRFPFEGGPALAAFVAAMWIVGWLAGRIYGARLDEIQLRREIDLTRQLAEANEERIGIARELHDIIGHTVNVMVVHAGAGRQAVGRDNALVEQAFETIESTGRAALSELDRVLAVLRRDDVEANRLPTPHLADLGSLASTFADTGLEIDVEVSGKADSVPASVGLTAYRIVQEALTNTMRHGEARRATVAVAVGDGDLHLSVTDDGRGDPNAIRPGRGIMGMSERAAVHNGSVDIVRAETGGVEVQAYLSWESDR